MRTDRRECPGCGSTDTDRAHVEFHTAEVEEVRQCNNCPVQFTNQFGEMLVRIDEPAEWGVEPTDGFVHASDLEERDGT